MPAMKMTESTMANRSFPPTALGYKTAPLSSAIMAALLAWPTQAMADTEQNLEGLDDACLLNELKLAEPSDTVQMLQDRCLRKERSNSNSLVLQRREREKVAASIRSILTPHKRNYLMPATYLGDANEEVYLSQLSNVQEDANLHRSEIKFQLSLKFNVANDLLLKDDSIHFGFSALSFWQAYNSSISAPFRETNYEPEVFWTAPIDWRPFGLNANVMSFGASHQSNGRSGALSRSWNRVYANFTWEKNRWVFSFKPWYRIPEDEKETPLSAEGDDNPDIEKFLGHFEFTTIYRKSDQEISLMLRNNLRSDNRGAVQLDYTFPLWKGVRGYAQYFNGYGESLIDYDANVERIGIGILLSDLL